MNFWLNFIILNTIIFNFALGGDLEILPYCDSGAALRFIAKYLPKSLVILEAGAFDGTETRLMKSV